MCRNRQVKRILSAGQPKASSAFTLIEILIVIVIIGIAAAMAVPMISSAASFQLRSAANTVAADLEYAKSMAISRGQLYSVVFNTGNSSYEIVDQGGGAVQQPITKQSRYIVNFPNDSRLNDVTIVSASFGGAATVTFDYLGSPQGPLAEGIVTLQAGGAAKSVKVEPVTGFISISD